MLLYAGLSDIGCRREKNEDTAEFFESPYSEGTHLLVVADGVGGSACGDVASRLAVKTIHGHLFDHGEPDDLEATLREAVEVANREIHRQGSQNPDCAGMATTCTAAAIRGFSLMIAHVGDCRAYLLRGNRIDQLTDDHSLAAEYERRGEPLPAQREALANVLTRCLGVDPEVRVDTVPAIPLREGNVLVVCSDGLTKVVNEAEIFQAVSESLPEIACRRLVDLALARGGPDNITLQVAMLKRV